MRRYLRAAAIAGMTALSGLSAYVARTVLDAPDAQETSRAFARLERQFLRATAPAQPPQGVCADLPADFLQHGREYSTVVRIGTKDGLVPQRILLENEQMYELLNVSAGAQYRETMHGRTGHSSLYFRFTCRNPDAIGTAGSCLVDRLWPGCGVRGR